MSDRSEHDGANAAAEHPRAREFAGWLRERFREHAVWPADDLTAKARAAGFVLAMWWDAPSVRALGVRAEKRDLYPGCPAICWIAGEAGREKGSDPLSRDSAEIPMPDEIARLIDWDLDEEDEEDEEDELLHEWRRSIAGARNSYETIRSLVFQRLVVLSLPGETRHDGAWPESFAEFNDAVAGMPADTRESLASRAHEAARVVLPPGMEWLAEIERGEKNGGGADA